MYASQRPLGEKAGAISLKALFTKGFGSPGFQPDFSSPSTDIVMMSKPVPVLSWRNASTLPSGRQEPAYCELLLSTRCWASPAPSARIHQRLDNPSFCWEE